MTSHGWILAEFGQQIEKPGRGRGLPNLRCPVGSLPRAIRAARVGRCSAAPHSNDTKLGSSSAAGVVTRRTTLDTAGDCVQDLLKFKLLQAGARP